MGQLCQIRYLKVKYFIPQRTIVYSNNRKYNIMWIFANIQEVDQNICDTIQEQIEFHNQLKHFIFLPCI
jgi:hypothetical protein